MTLPTCIPAEPGPHDPFNSGSIRLAEKTRVSFVGGGGVEARRE